VNVLVLLNRLPSYLERTSFASASESLATTTHVACSSMISLCLVGWHWSVHRFDHQSISRTFMSGHVMSFHFPPVCMNASPAPGEGRARQEGQLPRTQGLEQDVVHHGQRALLDALFGRERMPKVTI
jgi:hypothetical protein